MNQAEIAENSVRAALRAFCPSEPELSVMPGGASTRRFFRANFADRPSAVAMFVPPPNQKLEGARQTAHTAPFVEVRELLARANVAVPDILHHDPTLSVLVVEDLGDTTLAEQLMQKPFSREPLYREAVQTLALARQRLEDLPSTSVVRSRALDESLLAWEMDHFLDYGLLARGYEVSPSTREVFERTRDFLAQTIAGWRRGFVHRDYQSRNLMIRPADGRLVWIDFQDAMMGPEVYDLVALLTDSYQTFTSDFVDARLVEYLHSSRKNDFATLKEQFDLVTIQRKLKDAGRFVFMDQVNGNPTYLPYVASTIDTVFSALTRRQYIPELRQLAEVLSDVLDRAPLASPSQRNAVS